MDTTLKALGIVLMGMLILTGGTCMLAMGSCGVAMDEASREHASPTATADDSGEDIITERDFARIEEGMLYEQVVDILGREGQVVSEGGSEWGAHTVMYSWDNPGMFGGNMNAMFQNGRLVSKAQFGLE